MSKRHETIHGIHTTLHAGKTMYSNIIRFILAMICCLPTYVSAATNYSIHAEWTSYTPPSGFTVTGFKLYQEGVFACQNQNPNATAIDCTVSLTADTTNFTLTSTFSDGTESPHSSPFPFTIPSTTTTPTTPTAVIDSSVAAGKAPLTVTFNGSGSSATTNASITSYLWSFGDGTSAIGARPSHTFTTAGTYTTSLTVTDSKGLTNSTSTPVVITGTTTTTTTTNKAPTAIVSATLLNGPAPLAVTFNGSASTDTDGTIASYVWNFGDGSSATGKTTAHTYTTEATFTVTLQVTDNKGAKSTTSIPITVKSDNPLAGLNIEVGEIEVSSDWVRVPITSTFANPIVVAGPPSYNDTSPCAVRLRNISKTGFEIRIAEWNYLGDQHVAETVSYLVVEKGRTTLPDGSIVEAGTFAGTTKFQTIRFSKSLTKLPVVITTIASNNEADTISGRIKSIGLSSFAYYFREQEKNTNTHAKEIVNFIAWEPGQGTIGSLQFEAARTTKGITHAWYAGSFKQSFTEAPLILADMQTTNGVDTAALRIQQVTATGFQTKVEEEKSKDSEVSHSAETVGYLSISQFESK